jgi:predicted AAA+ superfamily ATPase
MEFPIYPLSFQEFCFFKKEPESRQNFVEYLKYGGLPGIFRMEYSDEVIFSYLFSVYNTIFVKDIIHHNVIKNVAFFEDLYKYTLSNIGNIITGESIKNYLKSQHIAMGNETILNFLHYGQETFLLNKVGSVNPDTKQYFEIYNKYYAGDLGLRNAFVGYTFDKDIGKLMENYVYLELKRHGYEVKIGRLFNKKEIDFIAEKHGIIKYFQVCYLMGDEKTMAREYSPLEEIHNSWEKFVVSFDEIDHGIHNGIKWVSVMNLNTLLSEV